MTDLFMTPEQGRNRLQEMREQVARSRTHPRTKHPTVNIIQADPEAPSTVSIENTESTVIIATEPTEPGIAPKTRRPRRTKVQMQEAREREQALNPAPISIETVDNSVLVNQATVLTVHNSFAKEEATEEETTEPEAYVRDPDALTPEGIIYAAGKVQSGRQLSMEDRMLLEAEARRHKLGLLPFVYTVAKVIRDFEAVIRSAQASLSLHTEQGKEDACFDLDTAIALTLEHPFLCTASNITLLDAVLFEAPVIRFRISVWRNLIRKAHGFDFKSLDAQRPPRFHDDLADMPSC